MDPITFILTALSAGAAAGGQAIASDAIKDAYAGLKALVQRKMAGRPGADLALKEHEIDPTTWEAPLRKALIEVQADQDEEVIQAARRILEQTHPQQAVLSKYNAQITGNVQGLIQGENHTITQHFGVEPEES